MALAERRVVPAGVRGQAGVAAVADQTGAAG
jgi:hypothetical protein